jgi:hypothetical protein
MSFQIFTQPSQQALDTTASVLSGATLTFTLTGTSTPTDAYSDSALTIPVSNPLSADSAGVWIPIFLDPEVVYRVVLKTQAGAVLKTWDPANEDTLSGITQEFIGVRLFPRTAKEVSASVTPSSYIYDTTDYTNVMRYVTNTVDGVNSQAAAVQKAFDIAKISGDSITFPSPAIGASYILDAPINATTSTTDPTYGFIVRGTGRSLAITPNAPYRPAVIIKHTGHGFDCTGSRGLIFENLSIGTDETTAPKTGIFFARNTGGGGSIHRLNNVRMYGKFSEACVYNYGAENIQFDACQLFNRHGGANAKVMYFTAYNIRALTSSFITVATGIQSTIDHKIFGGAYYNQTTHTDGDVIYIESAQSLKIYGPWMAAGDGGANPRSLIYVDATNGPSNIMEISGITGEHLTGLQTYGIRFGGETAQTFASWNVRSSTLPNVTAAISGHANASFSGCVFDPTNNQSIGGGIVIPNTISNSVIREPVLPLTIGTSTNNDITFNSSGSTITTRSGDDWHDTATRTWTPTNVGLVITGALTISNARFEYHGKQVTATFLMSAATSIVGAAGATMSGLPRAITIGAGTVIVTNTTDKTTIGIGYVSGTTIVLPAINETTDQIAVAVNYFVA